MFVGAKIAKVLLLTQKTRLNIIESAINLTFYVSFLSIEMSKTPVQDKIANKRRTSVCAVNLPYLCSEINFSNKNIMIMK